MSLSSQRRFLGQVKDYLDSGFLAYKDYLAEGSIFRHAKRLRHSNEQIKQLLLKHSEYLPHDQQVHARALLNHIVIWSEIWDRYYAQLTPEPDDIFIFENDATFPRADVDQLMKYLERISSD